MSELAVIIPVYNEEGAIENVLEKWSKELDKLIIDYRIAVYDDGSKDNSLRILKNFSEKNARIIPHSKFNSGHGPTILKGYIENSDAKWLFQVDSDDEISPEYFRELWEKREAYDYLSGRRVRETELLPRKIISMISRLTVWLFYGTGVYDVNCPYRLLRSEFFRDKIKKIPPDTFAPNLIISGLATLNRARIFQLPVSYKLRTTGEISIKKWKLFKAALKSFCQTISFRFTLS